MSRLSNISAKPTVVSFAQGAAQRAIQPVADFIAPVVEVATSVGQYKVYSEKSRFRIPQTERAVGGRATRVAFDADDATFNCKPHALDYPVDDLEKIESEAAGENMINEGSQAVAEIAALAHEKKTIDLAMSTAGAGTTLNVGSSDDVIDQIDTQIRSVILAAKYGSLMGVGVLFGALAWQRCKNHVSVRNRFVAGGKNNFANPSLADFSSLLLANPETKMSLMVYDNAAEGVAEDIKFVLDGNILVFARMANPTRRDPSFMKTFRLMGQWMKPGVYRTEDDRGDVVKYDWSEDVKVTNSAAIKRLNVS
jgi:hypothetical protein